MVSVLGREWELDHGENESTGGACLGDVHMCAYNYNACAYYTMGVVSFNQARRARAGWAACVRARTVGSRAGLAQSRN